METYLTEIKQLRIPRPKFEPISRPLSSSVTGHHHHPHHHHPHLRHFVRPFTPPRDYHLATNEVLVCSSGSTGGSCNQRPRTFQTGCAAEELRSTAAMSAQPTLHDKM